MNPIEEATSRDGSYTVSEGTLRSQDLVPKFSDALQLLAPDKFDQLSILGLGFFDVPEGAQEDEDHEWWSSEDCSWLLNEVLFSALNEFAPGGFYFGSHEGDGACFGFWAIDDREEEP